MTPEKILSHLDSGQLEAVEALDGPVCILAGAGTGKTRTITHRIAFGVSTGKFDPSNVLAITFTNKAAAELRSRLNDLGVKNLTARTFHSAALAQLKHFWPEIVGDRFPRLVDAKGPFLAQAAQKLKIRVDRAVLRDVAAEIEWRKVSGLSIDEYSKSNRVLPLELDLSRVAEIQFAYEKLKDEARQIDFEDVLLACAGMLESEPRVAARVRAQYRHFSVDEFQDVSALQVRLLNLWLSDSSEICVVGDVSQTIYSFAGADPNYLLKFQQNYPDARVIRLEHDYRSTEQIVVLANKLIAGSPGALKLVSSTKPSTSNTDTPPEFANFSTSAAEAEFVAEKVRSLLESGVSASEIAILFRTNFQAAEFESALATSGIPYRVLGGLSFFELPEIKQAVMMLKASAIAKHPEPLFKTVSDVLRTLGWTQDSPPSGGAVRNKWESLNTLLRMAEELPKGSELKDLIEQLEDHSSSMREPKLASVTLSTIHSAKGLEWDCVFIVGLREGLLPISVAKSQEAIEEERRLLYVAITRAKSRLILSWSAKTGQSSSAGRPSRFLESLMKAD
ncbi:MAG: ATP-dependent helicase [Cryobacterium sp.]|nr:ATP-dependent helicase [Cryobacterium sp.]